MPLPGPVACREASPDGRAPPRPKRTIHRYRRFPFYDYSRGAALFITISTSPRACLFGRVVEAKMELSPLGVASLWQQGCHDRICTSERFIDSTERYIAYNPLKWELGKNQPAFLRIREPLDSPPPESRYLPAIQELRYLEIAEGNEPTGFTRAACLDLNAAIIHIATEGEGLAVYWKEEGPTILGEGGASPSGLPATPGGASPSGLPATPGIKEQNGTSIDERDRP